MYFNRIFLFVSIFILTYIPLHSINKYAIIPAPQELIPQVRQFVINSRTRISCPMENPEILKLAKQFSSHFQIVSGISLSIDGTSSADTLNKIVFDYIPNENKAESYHLQISPATIRISSGSASGFFYGLQTLYQLMPVEIYATKKSTRAEWPVPAVKINDSPRFSYRGLHLDVSRHFFPVAFIKKYIDAMAIHKLNYFHWHLTDDQGWRIEIKKYPLLTQIGSKRSETLKGYYFSRYPQQFDGQPYGGFYTQEEAREIVEYARNRFITVIPEIEMPGHAQAALASYPFLSCKKDSTIRVATQWGVIKNVFCPRETTFGFLEDVLTEIIAIFPGKYIHIGGDECPKDNWKSCSDCQKLIKEKKLKDENELQSYFIHHIEKFLNSKGRQIIGWDEILDGGLAPNATVMSWRGITGGITAAKARHNVIMTPSSHCYFDYYQSNPVTEPLAIGGFLPLSKVYSYDPVPTELSSEESKYILGAQANLWSEYLPTSKSVEYMAFPRVSAISEVLWTYKENKNPGSFMQRMTSQYQRYAQLDINASNAFYEVQFKSKTLDGNLLEVSMSCDCPDAVIEYHLDGKKSKYSQAVVLNKSTKISAQAIVDKKKAGKQVSKEFLVSKLTGLKYSKTVNNSWYDGGNSYALTDGIKGNTVVLSQWVGTANAKDVELVFDLKKPETVSHSSVGALHATPFRAVLPSEISVFGSVDGKNYNLLATKTIPKIDSPIWKIIRPEISFPATKVQFLKFLIKSGGTCPASTKPDDSVLFLDEISAW